MYQYPTSASDFRLIPAGKFYTTRKGGPCLGIVLHITAGLQDTGMVGTDGSAEGVAKWAASGAAQVSWHVGVDSDSIVPCLPSTYTAWHAKGYNSRTFGIEISKRDVDWSDMPAAWVTATLKNAARALAPIVVEYGLPLALRTKAQVDAAIAANQPFGFVYHSTTSAGTRSDPGKNFPIGRLFDLIRAEINPAPTSPQEDDMPTIDEVWAKPIARPNNTPVPAHVALSQAMMNAYRANVAARELTAQVAALTTLVSQMAAAQPGQTLTAEEITAAAKAGAGAALDERITGAEVNLEVRS